jgi:hypothetical protein
MPALDERRRSRMIEQAGDPEGSGRDEGRPDQGGEPERRPHCPLPGRPLLPGDPQGAATGGHPSGDLIHLLELRMPKDVSPVRAF